MEFYPELVPINAHSNSKRASSIVITIPDNTFISEISDRKSTRLNSSHVRISYAVFCLKKKKKKADQLHLSSRLVYCWMPAQPAHQHHRTEVLDTIIEHCVEAA